MRRVAENICHVVGLVNQDSDYIEEDCSNKTKRSNYQENHLLCLKTWNKYKRERNHEGDI